MFDATPQQKVYITRLLMGLGIKEHIEETPMTKGEAGVYIRRLEEELKVKKRGR